MKSATPKQRKAERSRRADQRPYCFIFIGIMAKSYKTDDCEFLILSLSHISIVAY